MECYWNGPDGKTEALREEPVPLSLRPPRIPRRLAWD